MIRQTSKQGPDFLLDKDGNKESAADFANVETWIFDLDNTLYPHHLNLWQQVDVRIRNYIVDFLKVTHE